MPNPIDVKHAILSIQTKTYPNLLFADGEQTTQIEVETNCSGSQIVFSATEGTCKVTPGGTGTAQNTAVFTAPARTATAQIKTTNMPSNILEVYCYKGYHFDNLDSKTNGGGADLEIVGYNNATFQHIPLEELNTAEEIQQFIREHTVADAVIKLAERNFDGETAGAIIYSAALGPNGVNDNNPPGGYDDDINPKILLATMEKEQSLVTGRDNGVAIETRLNEAFGAAGVSGFINEANEAAKRMRSRFAKFSRPFLWDNFGGQGDDKLIPHAHGYYPGIGTFAPAVSFRVRTAAAYVQFAYTEHINFNALTTTTNPQGFILDANGQPAKNPDRSLVGFTYKRSGGVLNFPTAWEKLFGLP